MRIVIQRVRHAGVSIDGKIHSEIAEGMLVLAGIEEADTATDIEWITKKIVNLRIFDDAKGIMNNSILESGGSILLVSQFTLMASTAKGNRPSYIKAARPEISIPIYNQLIASLSAAMGKEIATGVFGADMQVELLNDGPVTIIIDSKRKE